MTLQKLLQRRRFLAIQNGCTVEETHRRGIPGTARSAGQTQKAGKTVWPAVAVYLDELPT